MIRRLVRALIVTVAAGIVEIALAHRVATHDPIAASFADRVIFLADGRVVADRAHMDASEIASFMLSIEQVA